MSRGQTADAVVACWRVVIAAWLGLVSAQAGAASADSPCAATSTEQGEAAVVTMLLSPRMPYALQEWRRMRAAAQAAGFRVAAYRDPRVPAEEWLGAANALADAELAGLAVMPVEPAGTLGLLNHSPAATVSFNGRSHLWPILGVMPDGAWRALLLARLETLRTAPCAPDRH